MGWHVIFLAYNRRTIRIFLGEKSSDVKWRITLCFIIFKYSASLGSQNTLRIKLNEFTEKKKISVRSVKLLPYAVMLHMKRMNSHLWDRMLEMITGGIFPVYNFWQVPRHTSMFQKIMKTNCPLILCYWTSTINATKYKEAGLFPHLILIPFQCRSNIFPYKNINNKEVDNVKFNVPIFSTLTNTIFKN